MKNSFIQVALPKDHIKMAYFRFGKLLIQLNAEEPLFSERMGFKNYVSIPFTKWRIRIAID